MIEILCGSHQLDFAKKNMKDVMSTLLNANQNYVCNINYANLSFKTPHCRVQFISLMHRKYYSGKHADVTFGIPNDISGYLVGDRFKYVPEKNNMGLIEYICYVENKYKMEEVIMNKDIKEFCNKFKCVYNKKAKCESVQRQPLKNGKCMFYKENKIIVR